MMRALWSAASGMKAQQVNIDLVSNNLANVNTTGYKKMRGEFQDLHYQTLKSAGNPVAVGTLTPIGIEIGMGVGLAGTQRFFSQGDFEQTENPYDLVVSGAGFFRLLNVDGTTVYSRDGTFKVDANGQLVNNDGLLVDPAIQVPPEASGITVGPDGLITATVNGVSQNLGQINLGRFVNPAGLEAIGKNLFRETPASGPAVQGIPSTPGFGGIMQGVRERSNVNVAEEMVNMITSLRAYEANSKAIQTSDEMLQIANNSKR